LSALFSSFLLLLALSGVSSQSVEEEISSEPVRIGAGCLQLPSSFRVVQTDQDEEAVDPHGFLDAPYQGKVYWSFGLRERDPLIAADERSVLWERTELVEGRKVRFGLVQEEGHRSLYAVDRLIRFRIDSEGSGALAEIRSVAASYHRRDHPEICRPPETNLRDLSPSG
jgi:hypothetical protein